MDDQKHQNHKNREAPYEAPEIMELDKVGTLTLGRPNLFYADNCDCTKEIYVQLS